MAMTCDMMGDHEMSSMSHEMMNHDMLNMSHDHSSMHHDRNDENTKNKITNGHECDSLCCVTSCLSSLQLISFDNLKIFNDEGNTIFPSDYLLSMYEVFLPIKTPPPLV